MALPIPRPPASSESLHEGGVLSLLLLIFGGGVAYFLTPILSGLLAIVVLWMGWKFLKWRVDPFDLFFWMHGKPSWTAVALTFLSGLALLGISYFVYVHFNDHHLLSAYLANRLGLNY
jgi:ABC-type antimicrobial peptide transport system permease subunit